MADSLLDHLLEPLAQSFTEQQARQIMEWRLDPSQEERLQSLREKANEGKLTEEEELEYKRFVEDLDVIAIIQSKARLSQSKSAA